ncbi:MAG: hypothetical protein H6604_09415 [Flavobacteriales bacterium]|nr:hypothetical protein [Flavobacteriales bacterium]
MKNKCILLLLILLVGCSKVIHYKTIKTPNACGDNDVYFEILQKSKMVDILHYLDFKDGFSDEAKVYVNDSLVFEGKIKTNQSLGIAKSIELINVKSGDRIYVEFSNKENLCFYLQKEYRIYNIYYSKRQQGYVIYLRNFTKRKRKIM